MSNLTLVCTLATLVLTILNIYKGLSHPVRDLSKRLDALEDKVNRLNEKTVHDWNSFKEQERVNAMLLKSMCALMSHELDGNHTKQLQECKDEIEDLIFKKGGGL